MLITCLTLAISAETMNTRKAFVLPFVLLFHFKSFGLGLGDVGTKDLKENDQELIDSLREYEFVQPLKTQQFTNYRSTAHRSTRPVKEIESSIYFSFRGKRLTLKLSLNRNLFSKDYFERDIVGDGLQVTRKNSHFCFYHGHVEGHKDDSVAAISTCDGINGYFTILNKTFLIQPVKSIKGEVFHVVFEAEDMNIPKYECGHKRTAPHKMDFSEATHRVRRDVLSETKYLEMVIVNDLSQYNHYKDRTSLRAKTLANIVDSVYRAHNIRVMLIMIETWKTVDRIQVVQNEQTTLENFEKFKKNVLDKDKTTKNDNAQLLTRRSFSRSIVGKASTLSICSSTSTAIVRDHSDTAALTASTMAHELGHNLGLDHDEAFKDGNCECGKSEGCVMAAQLKFTPLLKLSNCSQATLKTTLLKGYGTCLFDIPTKHLRHTKCGNAFVDEGEQCDCGTKEECQLAGNHCCNYTTCHFTPHSNCSDGPCCHNCKIKARNALCRGKVNDCDLPEYCDGKHSICAPDSYVHNGRPCGDSKSGKGLCYLGVCHTLEDQCKNFWGPGGKEAHVHCYRYLNVKSDQYGHCKKLTNGKYLGCKKEDIYCGKLQCENPPGDRWLPIIGTNRRAHYIPIGKTKCWSGVVYMGDDIPEPGMVQTGTICGENKVCYNNSCVDVDIAYKQRKCASNCSGNGICNNLGNCHCNYGYKCPDCKETCPGVGGSLDSGNGCNCLDVNSTVSPTFTTNIPLTTADIHSTVSTAFTTNIPSITEAWTTYAKITAAASKNSTSPTKIRPTYVNTDTTATNEPVLTTKTSIIESSPTTIKIPEASTTYAKTTAAASKNSTSPTKIRPTYVNTDTTATNEPVFTTKTSTTESSPTINRIPKGGPGDFEKQLEVSTAVIVIIVVIIVFSLFGVLFCYRYREAIGAKFRNTREPVQKPFTTVSYNRDRYPSESSEDNLTGRPSRPTRLEIGRPMPREVVITPDRNEDIKPKTFAATPSSPVNKETKPVPQDPRTPKLSPNRPPPPRSADRLLGPRNKSLPDLLDHTSSSQRPSAGPSLPSKAQSFTAHDKPTRPKVPKLPKLPSRQTSNAEVGAKALAKPSKHLPSTRAQKPGANLSSVSFGRSELRKTPTTNPKPTPHDASRLPAEAPPSGDNRSTVEHTFRPSDLKAGKSPFSNAV